MNFIKKIVWLLLVAFLIAGCIREDMDDCKNVAVFFRYDADGQVDVLKQYIDKIDLYIFDESHRLVRIIAFDQDDFAEGTDIAPQFRLSAGKYTLVAVGNAYDRTTVEGLNTADFSRMFIQHPQWGNEGLISGHDHNYMGQREIVVPSNNEYLYETVRLYSSHIDVDVEIHGFPTAEVDGQRGVLPCTLSFEDSNAQTDFNNEINAGQTCCVVPDLHYDATTDTWHTRDFTLFRMDRQGTLDAGLCCHRLRLEDAEGNPLAEFDMAGYLEQHRDVIDVTRQEARLPISIVFTPLGVTIKIPAWYIEDITPGWQ